MAWKKIREKKNEHSKIEYGWYYYKIIYEISYNLFGNNSKIYNNYIDKMYSTYNRNEYGDNMHEK